MPGHERNKNQCVFCNVILGQVTLSPTGWYLLPGPEKYREHRNSVPRKADCWQEARSLYHEESGRKVVFYAIEGEQVGKVFNYGSICT